MLPTDEDMAWFAKKKKVSAPRAESGQDYLRLTFGQPGGGRWEVIVEALCDHPQT